MSVHWTFPKFCLMTRIQKELNVTVFLLFSLFKIILSMAKEPLFDHFRVQKSHLSYFLSRF